MSVTICTNCKQKNPVGHGFCSSCGTCLTALTARSGASTELQIGTWLRDRYIIQRHLGKGGFGQAYLAEDTGRFNEKVVIKELSPTIKGTNAIAKAEELFQREAQTLYQLQHPQIPKFWEIFRSRKRLFLVQDFVEGKTYYDILLERLQQGQCFSEAEIIQLFRELLPVLSYLHSRGIIHRDISPDNIIQRESDGLPVLIDMGGVKQVAISVAQVADPENAAAWSSIGTRLGKIGYAPDEQLGMGLVAPHSDLYGLAATALYLMSGKQPQEFRDPNTTEWLWEKELTLSPAIAYAFNRMLDRRPEQRFQTAEQVLVALSPLTQPVLPRPVAKPQFSIQELLIRAMFTGFEGGMLAIALNSLFKSPPITALLVGMMLGGLIYAQYRRIIEKNHLAIIASITLVIVLLFAIIITKNPVVVLEIVLKAILAGVLAYALMALSQIVYKLFFRHI